MIVAIASAAILVAAGPWQMRWGVIPDTSWIITVCERLLAGERLYVDVIETNPPFTIWVYMPPVALAKLLGIPPEPVVHLYTYAFCVGGLALAGIVAWRARFPQNRTLFLLLPAILALLVLFPGNSFSEREHLGVALLLPMLVLAAWRAMASAGNTPPVLLACLAGIAGAVIVLVKPYYVLLVVAPAVYVAIARRSIRPLFSTEYLVAGSICVAYGTAVLVLYPAFMRDIYPLLGDTYMQVRRDSGTMLGYGPLLGAWLLLMYLPRRQAASSSLATIFAIASVAAYLPLFYQGKGWPYHAYPAVALGIGALLCRYFAPGRSQTRLAIIALVVFVAAAWLPYLPTQKPTADVVAQIRVVAQSPTVGLVGSSIESGHPLARMVGGRWISAYCSDWLGAFALHLGQVARREGNAAAAARYEALAEHQIAAKIEELRTDPPGILLVESGTLWLKRLEAREAYRDFRAGYRLLVVRDGLEIYRRASDVSTSRPESPAAASG